MKRFTMILILAGIACCGLWAQDAVTPKKTENPGEKMSLRVNTRDRVMICKGNATRLQIQRRQNPVMKRSQMMRHQRMWQHQRGIRQPMRRDMQRRAIERHMMQQQRRPNQRQPNGPGGN